MNDNLFGSLIRKDILYYFMIVCFCLFAFRLFNMQILENNAYQEKSSENSIKGIVVNPPRGVLYDRNFNYLVSNKPAYKIEIIPSLFDPGQIPYLEKIISVDSGYVNNMLQKYEYFPNHIPRTLIENAEMSTIAWVEENKNSFPGIKYTVDLQRDYSFGVNGSHIFGYIREIDSKNLDQNRELYELGDFIGYSGLEKTYEHLLRGKKGMQYYVTDSRQRQIRRYKEGMSDVPAEKGLDLLLTIDREVQRRAEEFFRGKKGAIVAIEPATGEIIAFVSAPNYSLDELSSINSKELWQELTNNPEKPLFNRTTMSGNPPGSTFKMIAAVAALESGLITTKDKVNCPGGFQYGDRFFKCTHVHGKVNIVSAIEKSCNTFFYRLILKIGLERWSKVARKFGFGRKTGVDISEESSGIIPDAAYFDRVYGAGIWTSGYTVSLAIGQGDIITTPLQLAQYASLISNNCKSFTPHFVRGFIDSDNSYIAKTYPEINADISAETMAIIKEGMYKVINGNGTAGNIRSAKYAIAGKTGTAQNPHGEDHALFVAFAPFENPQIAVAVLVENAGFGSTHAAPIAKEIIELYLDGNYKNEEPKVAETLTKTKKNENKL